MKTAMQTKSSLLFAMALAIGAAACGSDAGQDAGDAAYLTIQGDANLFLEPGFERDLIVKYHDGNGDPLTGEVTFEVVGNAQGSTLDKSLSATDPTGSAAAHLIAGENEGVFRIKASAEFATPVEWTISVTEGVVAKDLDIRGKYELDSQFDVIHGLPGNVGTVANTFADMTDDPFDPATWIIDQLLEQQDSGTLTTIVNATRPALDGIINDALLDAAPDFVTDLVELGDSFGDVSRNFGILSQLEIAGDSVESNALSAVHTTKGFSFQLDSESFIFTNSELLVDDFKVENVSVALDRETNVASFGQHEVGINYGGFLAMALDNVIIPRIDSNSNSLGELLSNNIPCDSIGQSIADFVGFGSAGLYEGACNLGLEAGANIAMEQLRDIDQRAQVKLNISGAATMKDPSGDAKADTMTQGKWDGSIQYLDDVGELADEVNTFTGQRMN